MKVQVFTLEGQKRVGTLIGILRPDPDRHEAVVVRLDNTGLYLDLFHPSHVTPVEAEE